MSDPSILNDDHAQLVAEDRRRPGRMDVDPALVPLLRHVEADLDWQAQWPDESDEDWQDRLDERSQDTLGSARGITLGVALSMPVWLLLGYWMAR